MKRLAVFFGVFLIATIGISMFALAHGVIAPEDKTLHPPTQIGLPESRAGHGHETGLEHTPTEGSLTRNQIAALIDEDQDRENFRSGVKFIILAMFISVIIALFYPKRPMVAPAPSENISEEQRPDAVSSAPKSV